MMPGEGLRQYRPARLAVLLAGMVLWAGGAAAQPSSSDEGDGSFVPTLVGSLDLTLRNDHAYASDVANKRLNDLFMTGSLKLGLFLSPELSVRSTITLQPMKVATKTRWLKSEGAFVEELNLKWEPGDFLAYVGKFDPAFGVASKDAPGVFGTEFTGDYLIKEAMGVGGGYAVRTEDYGTHTLGLSAFFLDNTPLSQAVINTPRNTDLYTARNGRNHSYYGGVGNTEAPQSLMLSLDGNDFPGLPDLRYQIAANMLQHDKTESRNQYGYVAGVKYLHALDEDVKLGPVLEYCAIENVGGATLTTNRPPLAQMQSGRYATAGLELKVGNWSLSTVKGYRWSIEPANNGPNGRSYVDQLQTESIGYTFDFGLGFAVAHKHVHMYDPISATRGTIDAVGVQSTYSVTF